MLRETKITAIPVEQEVANAVEGSAEPKTDADKMTDVMKEVTVTDEPTILTEEYVQPMPVAKPKAKRAPSKCPSVRKPKVVEPVVEVKPSLDEVQVDVTFPVEEAKATAKVKCPDCGKLMSEKTLRYSHGPNCTVKKHRQAAREQEMQSVTNDIVEQEVRNRLQARREERVARRGHGRQVDQKCLLIFRVNSIQTYR